MSVQNMGYRMLREISIEIVHHDSRVGWVNKNQTFFGSSRYDVGVVVLKERKGNYFVEFFECLH